MFSVLSSLVLVLCLCAGVRSEPSALAAKPYMGWSSWGLSCIKNRPPYGRDWMTHARIAEQSDAMNKSLQHAGCMRVCFVVVSELLHADNYINIDSFWASDPTKEVDAFGRWTSDLQRFPQGFAGISQHVHAHGQKIGIYLNPGIARAAVDKNTPIEGTSCHARDIAYQPMQSANVFYDCYRANFSHPCTQAYFDSFARSLASWQVDLLKLDAVSPGSGSTQFDNRPDVQAWSKALKNSGRDIWLIVSWHVDIKDIAIWKQHSQSWRIEDDINCYCDVMVQWPAIKLRFADLQPWVQHAGPGGWTDLDSLDVGNGGSINALDNCEKWSYATLWAISAAPYYTGSDLTKLDAFGLQLFTNPEVIAVNQRGRPARPTNASRASNQQVWYTPTGAADRSVVVALFNLADTPFDVTAHFDQVGLAGVKRARVRDLWSRVEKGVFTDQFTDHLPRRCPILVQLTPAP